MAANLSEIRILIEKGEYPAAEALLLALNPKARAELRSMQYFQAKILLYSGDWSAAKSQLLSTLEQHGPHLSILADIAACHFMQGDLHAWRKSVLQLQDEIAKVESIVSSRTCFEAKIFLAKNLEEMGNIAEALDLYEGLLKIPFGLPEPRLNLLAQVLRLKSYFRDQRGLARHYSELIEADLKKTHQFSVEVLHSLMLAEIALFGIQHGRTRLEKILVLPALIDSDRWLVLIDFLEECIHAGCLEEHKDFIKSRLPALGSRAYEQEILSIAIAGNAISLATITKISSVIPLGSYLRLLSCCIEIASDSIIMREISRKLFFLIESMGGASQQLWKMRIQGATIKKRAQIILSPDQISVACDQKLVSLNRNKTAFRALYVLAKSEAQSISIEEFVTEVWGTKYNASYYARARMLISRLNARLGPLLGVPGLLRLNSCSVSIFAGVELRLRK